MLHLRFRASILLKTYCHYFQRGKHCRLPVAKFQLFPALISCRKSRLSDPRPRYRELYTKSSFISNFSGEFIDHLRVKMQIEIVSVPGSAETSSIGALSWSSGGSTWLAEIVRLQHAGIIWYFVQVKTPLWERLLCCNTSIGWDLGLTDKGRFRRPVGRADGARLSPVERQVGHVGHVAGHADQLVALLVHEQLALGALEALPAQSPDAVVTVRAVRPLEIKKKKAHQRGRNDKWVGWEGGRKGGWIFEMELAFRTSGENWKLPSSPFPSSFFHLLGANCVAAAAGVIHSCIHGVIKWRQMRERARSGRGNFNFGRKEWGLLHPANARVNRAIWHGRETDSAREKQASC